MSYFALIRAGVVVNVVRMDVPPPLSAITPPADLVEDVTNVRCEPTFLRSGPGVYTAPPPPPEVTNANTMDQQMLAAMDAIDTYNALATPTAAQRLNHERLLGKCVKQLIRFRLGKLDATT